MVALWRAIEVIQQDSAVTRSSRMGIIDSLDNVYKGFAGYNYHLILENESSIQKDTPPIMYQQYVRD